VNSSKPSAFSIPVEISPLISELSRIYSPQNHELITEVLTELIARLIPNDPLTNPIAPDNLINADEISTDDVDIKSWDDLLNFTVYIDTEIYSPNEPSEAIADPEVTPETVMVIAPQEAIDA
jgi:hypothetical protein